MQIETHRTQRPAPAGGRPSAVPSRLRQHPRPSWTSPRPAAAPTPDDHDAHFRRLLGDAAWVRLNPAIRARFVTPPDAAAPTFYDGAMTEIRRSRVGALLAHLCRLIGTPLAPFAGRHVPVRVKVYANGLDDVVWERVYRFPGRRPLTVVSSKRRDDRTGLIECVGRGFGMALDVAEHGGALHFTSRNYFWQLGTLRVPLPGLLSPGVTHVVHTDLGAGRFRFTMRIQHKLLGETFFQDGVFHDIEEA